MKKHTYPVVLSIAGSDSVGGAGIQADIKTCCSIGVYAMTAITAITAQNTVGVKDFLVTPAGMLRAQIETVVADVEPSVVKLGMIPDEVSANVIADYLEQHLPPYVVVDPVMVATSGDSLTCNGAVDVLKRRILPFATIVTPNIPECVELSGIEPSERNTMVNAADKIIEDYGCMSVLIKGGHGNNTNRVEDFLMLHNRRTMSFCHPRVDTVNTHGTGCSLSSAIAAYLALGRTIPDAVRAALNWEFKAIAKGAKYQFGSGHGPINHIFKTINK